jgi:exosortase D (VPLPA-CTERM-specific)
MNLNNKLPPRTAIFGFLLAIGLLWAYWPVLKGLLNQLWIDEDFSFGLLLPLVSGFVVYLNWPQIRRQTWQTTPMGLVILIMGLALYIAGELSTDLYTPRVSFLVSLFGCVLLLGGWQIVRRLWFPFLLLLFMIPFPPFIMRQLTLPLQLLSSRLATDMLQLVGIPAVRQGNIIDLGIRQLQVVAACSGLRYILSLLAMGVIYCYFYQQRLWKAGILIVSLIPAAVIANALRVAAMGVYPALLEGFWHSFSGWLIFVFCLGFLVLIDLLLNFRQPRVQRRAVQEEPLASVAEVAGDRLRPAFLPLIAALLIVLVAGYCAKFEGDIPPVPLLQSFDKFPLQLGTWQGRQVYIDPDMVEGTGASAHLNAEFLNPGKIPVSLWIAYYTNQTGGRSAHSPLTCLRGGGWTIIKSEIHNLAPGMPVRFLVMEQRGLRYAVYYWYLQRGRWLASEYLNKFYLSFDGLLNRRADGALIRLITPIEPDLKSAKARLTAFADLLVPVLPQFIQK